MKQLNIDISGKITLESAGEAFQKLYDVSTEITEIHIDINSTGGSFRIAKAIYETATELKEKGVHITTKATGDCMSAAVVVLLAGNERVGNTNTEIVLHRVYRQGVLDVTSSKEINAIITKETTLQPDWTQSEFIRLDANEAFHYGFLNKLVAAP